MQASWLTSSRPCSFFNKGCFKGSFEYLQSSSGLRRLAVDSVFVRVLFGGGLKLYVRLLFYLSFHCSVTIDNTLTPGGHYWPKQPVVHTEFNYVGSYNLIGTFSHILLKLIQYYAICKFPVF